MEVAIEQQGDGKLTVWRGDYGFARVTGMAPNNDIRQPDAKAVAAERAKKNQITHLYDDLVKLEGTAIGRQYICTTSELALLTRSFASESNAQEVNLGGLPPAVKERVLNWLATNGPEGVTQAEIDKAREAEIKRGDSVVPAAGGTGKEIRDAMGIPGTIVNVTILDKAAGTVRVEAQRKAFQIVIDKDAVLPGIYSLGGPIYEEEQEIHGLERVNPWRIKATHEAKDLTTEFPVTGAEPAKAPGGGAEPVGQAMRGAPGTAGRGRARPAISSRGGAGRQQVGRQRPLRLGRGAALPVEGERVPPLAAVVVALDALGGADGPHRAAVVETHHARHVLRERSTSHGEVIPPRPPWGQLRVHSGHGVRD